MSAPRSSARLIFLPGMGADARVFAGQRAAFPRLEVPAWLEPRRGEALAEYGRRLAAMIDPTPPFYLGGLSLGGMVALELARHLPARAVFLMASFRKPPRLPLVTRLIHPVFWHTPLGVQKAVTRACPAVLARVLGPVTRAQRDALVEMFQATPPGFMNWAGPAVMRWPGVTDLPMPVYHIHGACDRMIPVGTVQPDEIVMGAGHALPLTHPEAVNRFIAARVTET